MKTISEEDRVRLSHTAAEIAFEQGKTAFVKEYRKIATVLAVQIQSDVLVETREGWLRANVGDYLVANRKDTKYPWPVKKEIFESTYVEVSTEQPQTGDR